jgi:hypothetical protein
MAKAAWRVKRVRATWKAIMPRLLPLPSSPLWIWRLVDVAVVLSGSLMGGGGATGGAQEAVWVAWEADWPRLLPLPLPSLRCMAVGYGDVVARSDNDDCTHAQQWRCDGFGSGAAADNADGGVLERQTCA